MIEISALRIFYDRRHGLVEVADDVFSVVRQLKAIYGDKISVHVDPDTGWYYFVENCRDGRQRLIFTTPDLDPQTLARLSKGDQQSRSYEDPYDFAEREQDRVQDEAEARARERLRAEGERLARELKQDGLESRLPLQVPVHRPEHYRRGRRI